MGHKRLNVKKVVYVCPDCNGELELRKTLPANTMNLVCKKSTQLPRQEGWEKAHGNFTDDCGFRISYNNKGSLETR